MIQDTTTSNLSGMGTKERIMRTAERLVAAHGFERVSLRDITTEARVNLAAVHYHYENKDGLLDAIILRFLRPLNQERLRQIDRAEAAMGGRAVPAELVVETYVRPMVALLTASEAHASLFLKILALTMGDPNHREMPALEPLLRQVRERYIGVLARSMPDLSVEALGWRLHFAFSAAMGGILHGDYPRQGGDLAAMKAGLETMVTRLVEYCAAGLRAPCGEACYQVPA